MAEAPSAQGESHMMSASPCFKKKLLTILKTSIGFVVVVNGLPNKNLQ